MGKYHNEIDMSNMNNCYSKIINQINDNSLVLEFGPAEGVMTKYLKEQKGCKICIVEIDREAYIKAKEYCVAGILGDIEDYEWEKAFAELRFDYIVFSDVLEHLRNPQKVLQKTKALLKDDGTVLASIPNIAHNDIILKLCDNRFDYTNIGLLDSTHIHFFAYGNLDSFFNDAGYRICREDYVESKTFHTEQAHKAKESSMYIRDEFYKRPCGEIYQFIISAQKEEYVKKIGKERISHINTEIKSELPVNYELLLQEKREIIEQKENYIEEQRNIISERDQKIVALNGTIEQKENYIGEQRDMISERDQEIMALNGTIEQKENYIGEQRDTISERDHKIMELNGIIEQKENYIGEQRNTISERDREIMEQNGTIEQKENYIGEQRDIIGQKSAYINSLIQGLLMNEQLTKENEKRLQEEVKGFTNKRIIQWLFKIYRKKRV